MVVKKKKTKIKKQDLKKNEKIKIKDRELVSLEINLKGKHRKWINKLIKRLNCRYTIAKGIMMMLAWTTIVFLIALIICVLSNTFMILHNQQINYRGYIKNNSFSPSCEFNHPLTGECTVWEDLDEDLGENEGNQDEDESNIESIDLSDQRVMAVMIENHPEARPQSGLSDAQVVYEALVEGGITRFMALYDNLQDKSIEIGPVRSARPYYLWFAYELDNALYGHVGGSPEALEYIQVKGLNDCDEFLYGGVFYERISSRRAPHNTYTTVGDLEACNDGAAMGRLSEIDSWDFMLEGQDKVISSPDFSEINIYYSDYTYLANWQYNQVERLYYRFYADGQPNIDNGNNKQIATSNIVVLEMPSHVIDDYGRLSMESIGKGELIIYRKGEKVEGTWEKEAKDERIKFVDYNGNNIELVPGKVWVEIVPNLEIVEEE